MILQGGSNSVTVRPYHLWPKYTDTATNFSGPEYILHNIDTYFKDKGKPR